MHDFSDAELAWTQSHLRILCGLYGALRPLDAIRPYRLEAGTRLRTPRGPDLYAFWGGRVTALLNEELAALPEARRVVVNVASQEYWKLVRPAELAGRVLTIAFPGAATVYAKEARGAIVRFAAKRGLTTPEGLREFTGNAGEWRFAPEQSSDSVYTFVRGKPAAAAAAPKAKGGAAAGGAPRKRKPEADADAAAAAGTGEKAAARGSSGRKRK